MKIIKSINKYISLTIFSFLLSFFCNANETELGVPTNWGIDLQNPITDVAQNVYDLHVFKKNVHSGKVLE